MELHWLPVEQRAEFKILLFTYKVVDGMAPVYLQDLLNLYRPYRSLRPGNISCSFWRHNLIILKSYGFRAFSILIMPPVSPQFEMQDFVPGNEPIYINNQAPSLLLMPSNLFKHEPKSRLPWTYIAQCQQMHTLFSIGYNIASKYQSLFHCQ